MLFYVSGGAGIRSAAVYTGDESDPEAPTMRQMHNFGEAEVVERVAENLNLHPAHLVRQTHIPKPKSQNVSPKTQTAKPGPKAPGSQNPTPDAARRNVCWGGVRSCCPAAPQKQ